MRKFSQRGFLNRKCDIYERSDSRVGKQPVAPEPVSAANDVPCRTWPISLREQATLIGQFASATHRIALWTESVPAGFKNGWEVQIGAQRFRVLGSVDAGGFGEITLALAVVIPSV